MSFGWGELSGLARTRGLVEQGKGNGRMRRFGIALALFALLFAGLLLGWWLPNPFLRPAKAPSQPPEQIEPVALVRVMAQGKLQPAGGILNIFAPPGTRLMELLVKEGETVRPGQELLRFTGQQAWEKQVDIAKSRTAELRLELQQKLQSAEANFAAAELAVKNAELNLQQAQAEPALKAERDSLELARKRLAGIKQLAGDPETSPLISPLTVAEQELQLEAAEQELLRGERTLEGAQESLRLAVQAARQNQESASQLVALARNSMEVSRSAELAEELAVLQVSEGRLQSPVDGQVLRINAREGDTIGATPILQLGRPNALECLAEVNDALVGNVRPGQTVKLRSPALPRPLTGTVVEVGRLVGVPTLREPDPLALVDRRSVEAKISVDPGDVPIQGVLLNLQVTVEIDLENR